MPALKYKKKTYAGATFPVLEMTKAEYDALPSSKQNDGTVYLITDDDGGWEAERSTYDNTESGLAATNVQAALDEIKSTIDSELGNVDIKYISGTQQSGSLNANATAWVSVPYTLPQGYRAIGIAQCYATAPSHPIMIYQFSLSQQYNIVSVAIRNIGSGATTYTVDASVMCVKFSPTGSSSSTTATSSLGGTIYLAQTNGSVVIEVPAANSVTLAAYETKVLCTVPVAYRPSRTINVVAAAADRNNVVRYMIKDNGELSVYNPGGALTITLVPMQLTFMQL